MKLYSPLRATENTVRDTASGFRSQHAPAFVKCSFQSTVECPNSLNHSRCATRLLPQKKKKSWLISAVQVPAIAIKKKKEKKKKKKKKGKGRRRRGRKFPARAIFFIFSFLSPFLLAESSAQSRSEILFSNESTCEEGRRRRDKRMRRGLKFAFRRNASYRATKRERERERERREDSVR